MVSKKKVLVIGCGRMGWRDSIPIPDHASKNLLPISHIESVHESSDLILSGVVDTNFEILKKAERKLKVDVFTSLDLALKKCQPDIVTIATRTPPKPQILVNCIKNGIKAIHVEKPLCRDLNELDLIRELSLRNKVLITLGTFRRYLGIYNIAKRYVYDGHLGKPNNAVISISKGPVMWTHPHSFDMANFLAHDKEFKSVRSLYGDIKLTRNIDDSINIDGDPIHIFSNIDYGGFNVYIQPEGGMNIKIYCEKGYLRVSNDGDKIFIADLIGSSPCYRQEQELILQNKDINYLNRYRGTKSALLLLCEGLDSDYDEFYKITTKPTIDAQKLLFASINSGVENRDFINHINTKKNLFISGKSPMGLYA